MSANLGFIAHAPEREPDELAARSLGDRHSKRGLAHARRAGEAEYGALRILYELADGQEFEDAVLDLLQTVVVFVQDFFGVLDGAGFLGALLPGHRQQPVDVIAAHRGLGRHGRHGFELLELLDRLLEDFLGHAGGFDFLAKLVELALLAAAQFLLDGLDFFVEVVLFLGSLHLALHARLNVAVEIELLYFDIEHIGNAGKASGGVKDAEQFLLFLYTQLEIGRDDVRKLGGLIHPYGGDDGFIVERLLELDVLLKEAGDALHELLDGRCHLELGPAGAHGGDEKAVTIADVCGLGALHAFNQNLDVAIGHLDALHDVADGADLVDFLGLGLIDGGVMLGGEKDLAVAVESLFEGAHARLAAHDEGGHHIGEDHHVPDGHHGQFTRLGLVAGCSHKDTQGFRRARQGPAAGRIRRLMLGLYSGNSLPTTGGSSLEFSGPEIV